MATFGNWNALLTEYALERRGVLYAGAHVGEHVPGFLEAGFEHIIAVEPNPVAYKSLCRLACERVQCVNAAVSVRDGTAPYYIIDGIPTLNSMLAPNVSYWRRAPGSVEMSAERIHEVRVSAATLKTIVRKARVPLNFLYLNIQGPELAVMRASPKTTARFDAIFTEVNLVKRYHGLGALPDLQAWLEKAGFQLMLLQKYRWSGGDHGEALFVRNAALPEHRTPVEARQGPSQKVTRGR